MLIHKADVEVTLRVLPALNNPCIIHEQIPNSVYGNNKYRLLTTLYLYDHNQSSERNPTNLPLNSSSSKIPHNDSVSVEEEVGMMVDG